MTQPIDFTKRFIPERLTPLYHTAAYAELSSPQRLRYNQLHASYFNEQVIFFESLMAQPMLRALIRSKPPDVLAGGLRTFLTEEAQHSQMFRDLNRNCLPERYIRGDFHFIHVPACSSVCLRQWVRHPKVFPFFLWILLIQEERSLFCARQFLEEAPGLEPNFVLAQRRHLADEAGHIQWDQQLLDWVWPQTGRWRRQINAVLFAWMMREYFTSPKRSGLRVVAHLAREFPELEEKWFNLRDQMLALREHKEYNLLSYSRVVTPKTFARFDLCAEFNSLGRALPGYHPPGMPNSRSTDDSRQPS